MQSDSRHPAATTRFDGIWVPLVTPFRGDGVDLAALQRLAQHLISQGVDGLVVCGTTGEPATLSETEQDAVLSAVLEVAGPCPVLFGLCGNDTAAMVETLRRRSDPAVAAYLISAPYYTRPSQSGIRLHFEALAAATDKPIVIYNIPYRSGVNIELETLQSLARNPQFAAIKQSAGNDPDGLAQLIEQTPLKVLSGEDAMIFVNACLGGHGAIAAAAHIRPDLYRCMFDRVRAGDLVGARRIASTLLPWIRLLFSEPNPAPLKAALALQGLIEDGLRLPMTPVSDACRARIEQMLPQVLALSSAEQSVSARTGVSVDAAGRTLPASVPPNGPTLRE
jgi:4-hydroxy-tetrahydrodipicolinate synthase